MAIAQISYSTDWKNFWAMRFGSGDAGRYLLAWIRLPIIGFDTITIIADYGVGDCDQIFLQGGFGYVMRDYLKNDVEVYICPDGFFEKSDLYVKNPNQLACRALMMDRGGSYLWLPHRGTPSELNVPGGIPCTASYVDQDRDITHRSVDKPSQLLQVDLIIWGDRDWTDPVPLHDGMQANHSNSSIRGRSGTCGDFVCSWGQGGALRLVQFDPRNKDQNNPEDMPLGSNQCRVDGRVVWKPWQDVEVFRWNVGGNGWHLDNSW